MLSPKPRARPSTAAAAAAGARELPPDPHLPPPQSLPLGQWAGTAAGLSPLGTAAVVDSGSSFSYLPPAALAVILRGIEEACEPDAGGYSSSCGYVVPSGPAAPLGQTACFRFLDGDPEAYGEDLHLQQQQQHQQEQQHRGSADSRKAKAEEGAGSSLLRLPSWGVDRLPTLQLRFADGAVLSLPPRRYLLAMAWTRPHRCLAFRSSEEAGGRVIIGASALMHHDVTFDAGMGRLSFALARCPLVADPPSVAAAAEGRSEGTGAAAPAGSDRHRNDASQPEHATGTGAGTTSARSHGRVRAGHISGNGADLSAGEEPYGAGPGGSGAALNATGGATDGEQGSMVLVLAAGSIVTLAGLLAWGRRLWMRASSSPSSRQRRGQATGGSSRTAPWSPSMHATATGSGSASVAADLEGVALMAQSPPSSSATSIGPSAPSGHLARSGSGDRHRDRDGDASRSVIGIDDAGVTRSHGNDGGSAADESLPVTPMAGTSVQGTSASAIQRSGSAASGAVVVRGAPRPHAFSVDATGVEAASRSEAVTHHGNFDGPAGRVRQL